MKRLLTSKMFRKITAAILLAVCLVVIFNVLHFFATLERGYQAVGGEILIFALPILWYAIKDTANEIKESNKK